MKKYLGALLATAMLISPAFSQNPVKDYQAYKEAVNAAASMSTREDVQSLLKEYHLDVLNFTWEDTGRTKGSSLGPNISDMSIQVHTVGANGKIEPVLMPVIRYPNFTDKSADLSPNNFSLLVGNEHGQSLKRVNLTQYLGNFRKYLSSPTSWTAKTDSLLSPRDTHVLVSAQVSYLPVPAGQKALFNPVLFNYQSSENNSAVLAILATREGTSATIINNTRDGFEAGRNSGQRLFFNENGHRASLTGEREEEFLASGKINGQSVTANEESGLNMVLLIQVPLKHKARAISFGCPPGMACMETAVRSLSQNAVIGHGDLEGPFTEIDTTNTLGETQQVIERDNRFPIRVTVQFYKATTSPTLTREDAEAIRRQIDKVYKNADFIGSLVTEGKTLRPTEHNVQCGYTSYRQHFDILRRYYGPYWTFFCESEESLKDAIDYVRTLTKK